MLDREGLSRAPHAGHYFIGDEENSVALANIRDALHVTFGRREGAERGAGNGLKDESGDVDGTVAHEKALKLVGAIHIAFGILQPERAAIAKAGHDMAPLCDHWGERLATPDIARDVEGAERGAVIALVAADDTHAFLFAAFEPILARELDRSFRRFRAARGEKYAAALAHAFRRESKESFGELFRGRGVEL